MDHALDTGGACAAWYEHKGKRDDLRPCGQRAIGVFNVHGAGAVPAGVAVSTTASRAMPLCARHQVGTRVGEPQAFAGGEVVAIEDAWKYRRVRAG